MSLFELFEFIRRALALNLSEPIWVRCELAQVQFSRGHCYLSLVEKNEAGTETIAQGEGVIWQKKLRQLRQKLGLEYEALMREGVQVLVLAKVDFHERYGLKLVVEDIDPAYSLGKMELQKQATIKALKKEGLMGKNGQIALPKVVQKIAVISSETAAGWVDFSKQLEENEYGYQFETILFPSAMQGENMAPEVIARLRQIEKSKYRFDALAIIRGGGAKLDLAAFDDLGIGRAVANMGLPVVTGIGHEVDETVLDLVAHTSLKTPTAVAEFFIQRAAHFEAAVLEMGGAVEYFAEQKIAEGQAEVERLFQSIKLHSEAKLRKEKMMLDFIELEVSRLFSQIMKNEKKAVDALAHAVELLRPETAFRRGFSLTSKNGAVITSPAQVADGDEILTQLKNGKVASTVKKQNDG